MLESNGKAFTHYFTVDEERRLMAHIKRFDAEIYARRDYWWMVFLRHTGLRISNLLDLTVADAKATLRTERLIVKRLKKRKKTIDGLHQTREFYANKRVRAALRHLLLIHNAMIDRDRWDLSCDDIPLIISRNQTPLSARSLELRMRQWCLSANLQLPATPHWWRHTWAKRRMAENNDMETLLKIQAHLDHSSLSVTSIYLQPDKEAMQAFLQRVV